MKLIKLILCKWLKIHWITEHKTVYDNGEVYAGEFYCDLCGYWPGIDDPDDYNEENYH